MPITRSTTARGGNQTLVKPKAACTRGASTNQRAQGKSRISDLSKRFTYLPEPPTTPSPANGLQNIKRRPGTRSRTCAVTTSRPFTRSHAALTSDHAVRPDYHDPSSNDEYEDATKSRAKKRPILEDVAPPVRAAKRRKVPRSPTPSVLSSPLSSCPPSPRGPSPDVHVDVLVDQDQQEDAGVEQELDAAGWVESEGGSLGELDPAESVDDTVGDVQRTEQYDGSQRETVKPAGSMRMIRSANEVRHDELVDLRHATRLPTPFWRAINDGEDDSTGRTQHQHPMTRLLPGTSPFGNLATPMETIANQLWPMKRGAWMTGANRSVFAPLLNSPIATARRSPFPATSEDGLAPRNDDSCGGYARVTLFTPARIGSRGAEQPRETPLTGQADHLVLEKPTTSISPRRNTDVATTPQAPASPPTRPPTRRALPCARQRTSANKSSNPTTYSTLPVLPLETLSHCGRPPAPIPEVKETEPSTPRHTQVRFAKDVSVRTLSPNPSLSYDKYSDIAHIANRDIRWRTAMTTELEDRRRAAAQKEPGSLTNVEFDAVGVLATMRAAREQATGTFTHPTKLPKFYCLTRDA